MRSNVERKHKIQGLINRTRVAPDYLEHATVIDNHNHAQA